MLKVFGVSTVATIITVCGWFLYQGVYKRRGHPFEVPHVCNQKKDHDVGDCLEVDNMHGSEGSNDDPILDPKHKIFLSHSGAQKEFVDYLCKAFEDQCHYPFFDRRHESLPKGERFLELIVQAAEQCEMLIVVVSDEYFMSKWPMIELSAFVKAHKFHRGSKIGPKILPLFYGLSVSDLNNEGMRKKWFQEWESLAEVDSKNRIVMSDWRNALEVLKTFNGLSYDPKLKEIVAYVDKIVLEVCKSIAPDIKWDDSHVQGKSNICKVIIEKIEGIRVSQKYQVKVVGVYGVGGIGKTTTCKTLCNELSSKFEGKVCHIEFPSVPSSDSKELFQKVLKDLTRKSMEVIQQLNEGECKNILRNNLFQYKSFLAIDNILDHYQSIQQAKMFLEVPYHKDGLVVVTARSQSVLELLGIDEDACLEIPDLREKDAVNLFLHHAIGGKQFFEDEEKDDIMTCIRRCYFSKGNGEDCHYHPLALQALGLQLGCQGKNPCDWVKNLPHVRTFNFFSGRNPVFGILRSSFDMLSPRDQTLFLDVGYFSMLDPYLGHLNIEWLCAAFNQDEEELTCRLEHLKRKGLLQDVDWRSERISIHDLYLEFAKLEANGAFNESTNLKKQMWVSLENGNLTELDSKPKGGYWHKLIRLRIKQSSLASMKHGQIVGGIRGMASIKWEFFSNVEVLQLCGLHWGKGALNLEGLVCLRVLQLRDVYEVDRIEGLEKLNHLTYFVWESFLKHSNDGMGAQIVGHLPTSLRKFFIWEVQVVFGSDLLAQCHQLCQLVLNQVEACSLDLSNCWSLESVCLWGIQKLQTLFVFTSCPPSNLHSLEFHECVDLVDIPMMDHLTGLKKLIIEDCGKLEVPSLLGLTELQVLSILGEQRLEVPTKDCFPRQLRELQWLLSRSNKELNLTGFDQLEVLDLTDSYGLTSLAELGDLPALQHLDLWYFEHLLQLPNLSSSKNLKELNLTGCSILELHEKDIQMLSELPLLQLVPFSGKNRGMFMLDLVRGKVLVHSSILCPPSLEYWNVREWKERDLGAPPIKIGRLESLMDNN